MGIDCQALPQRLWDVRPLDKDLLIPIAGLVIEISATSII
jgi:hypothetical protein